MVDDISFEQMPFGSDNFAENPEPRCPCVLLLDTSGSMHGAAINELNEGLRGFLAELGNDPIAGKRVELALITFGPVKVQSDFHTVNHFYFEDMEVKGDTPMGAAITLGVDMVTKRKKEYKKNGIG